MINYYSKCHALFVLKAALTFAKQNKKRLYGVAIDASKSFDKVNRSYLWVKLIELKVHEAIIRAVIVYYNESEIIVSLNNENSAPFRSTIGVRLSHNFLLNINRAQGIGIEFCNFREKKTSKLFKRFFKFRKFYLNN